MGGRVAAKGGEGRRVVGSRGGARGWSRCGEERQSRAESGHTLDARAIDRLTQACGLHSGLVNAPNRATSLQPRRRRVLPRLAIRESPRSWPPSADRQPSTSGARSNLSIHARWPTRQRIPTAAVSCVTGQRGCGSRVARNEGAVSETIG